MCAVFKTFFFKFGYTFCRTHYFFAINYYICFKSYWLLYLNGPFAPLNPYELNVKLLTNFTNKAVLKSTQFLIV